MPHGGPRPGAGRKSNQQISDFRTMLDEHMTREIWTILIKNLVLKAGEGNMRAMQLLLSYRFGEPHAALPPGDVNLTLVQIPHQVAKEIQQGMLQQLESQPAALPEQLQSSTEPRPSEASPSHVGKG
jgi:hypothetical protein